MNVVFCFDCEGTETQIRAVLDLAQEASVPLSIFAVGDTARRYPRVFREAAGFHEVHVHSDKHVRHRGLPFGRQQTLIREGRAFLEDLLGRKVTGFRAPYHSFDRNTVQILEEERFLFDVSGLYYHYPFRNVIALRPSWFREWAPWYSKVGVTPGRAFGLFRWLAKRKDPAVLPLHPHYTGASPENLEAFEGLLSSLRDSGVSFWGAEAYIQANI